MGFLADSAGSLGGALIGAAGSIYSGKQSADFAEKAYKHRYQWQMKDMQKAGLNPMLAFSNVSPNVPQPNFPNIGESAAHGAQAGTASSAQRVAAKVAEAQIGNLEASSVASTAAARKANAEAAVIEGGGSAKQAAEITELGTRSNLHIASVGKLTEEINSLKTTNEQLAAMLRLEREVKSATARSLEAGIPPKLLVGDLANIAREVVEGLRSPSLRDQASMIIGDAIDYVKAKASQAHSALQKSKRSIAAPPKGGASGSW